MKKLFLGSLAFAAMALTSCSEENEALLNNTLEVFTGEIVTSESRTSLGSDNSVLWSGDDAINLFKQTGYYQKYKVKQGGSATASFVYDNVNVKGNTLDQHYAVYPYAETNSIQGTTISVDLSSLANQTYTANSFEEEKAVMVAKSATTNLSFKNALSVIRVNLNNGGPVIDATVSSIKITSADKALTGMATVDMSQEMQPAVVAADGGKVITLTAPNVALGKEMTPFYIMFPAGNYAENELTVEVTAVINGESKVCEFPLPAVEIKRSMITTLEKTFDDDEEWTGSTEGEGEGDNISFVSNEEALQSVLEEGGIVKLANDIVTTESLSISEDVTIDLNGYDLDVDANGFVVAEGKKLTIIDSKAGSTMSARAASVATTITGTGDIITAKANSEITIGEGVNLITTGANCCCIFVPRYSENVTINSAGNLLATTAGSGTIYVNGYIENCTINITGGSVKHEQDLAVFIAGNTNLNISGGEIEGTTAVEIRAGQLNVTGGNFVATASEFTATPNGNGSTSTGAAIAVTQHGTNKVLNAMISGGTFTGVKALYEEDTCDDNVSGISMSVTGGTFNGDIFSENCKNFIQAGTFSNPSACNYLGEGANVTVELAEDYEGAGFATADGQTVVLDLNNKTYTATDPLVGSAGTKSQAFQFLKGSNVTIKNGTLTSSQARMFVQNYTDLTLENVTLSPSIPEYTTSKYYYVLSNNSGNVKLEGNTSIIAPTKNDISSFAFDVCKYANYEAPVVTVNTTGTIEGLVEVSGGTLNVTNGTFKNEKGHCVKVVNGTANFNGGNFTAQEVVVFNMAGTVNIAGGTFTSNDNAVISGNGSDDAKYKNGIIEITGGVFNAKIQSSGYVACGIYHPQAGTLKVSGGTFNIENGCGILMRGGSLDMTGNASFNFTGNISGDVTGKVGDSRVVVPCGKMVVKDAWSGYYDAQNINISGVADIYTVNAN